MNDDAIAFVDAPDVAGMGRLIVNGRHYGLPAEAVKQIAAWKAKAERQENALRRVEHVLLELAESTERRRITIDDALRNVEISLMP